MDQGHSMSDIFTNQFDISPARSQSRAGLALHLLGTGLLYLLLARISLHFVYAPVDVASVWPPSGLALAAVLLTQRRYWPAIFAVLFASITFANLLASNSLLVSLAFAFANCAESLLIASMLARWLGSPLRFDTIREVLIFFMVVTLGNALTAVLGASVAVFAVGVGFWKVWLSWWVADGLGIVLVTPLLLVWTPVYQGSSFYAWGQQSRKWKAEKILEGAALLSASAALSGYLFLVKHLVSADAVLSTYMLFPLLIWAGLRFNQRFMACLLTLISLFAILGTVNNLGQFAGGGDNPENSLQTVQLYLGVLIFTSYVFLAVFSEFKHNGIKLARSEAGYRGLFMNASIGIFYARPDGSFFQVNPRLATMLGYLSSRELLAATSDIGGQIFVDRSNYLELVAAVPQLDGWLQTDCTGRHGAGREILTRVSLRAVKSDGVSPAYLEGFVEDITEPRRIERALLETVQEFRSIVDSSPSAMQLFQLEEDSRLVLTNSNPAADLVLELDHLNLMGQSMDTILPELAKPETMQLCVRVARGEIGNQALEIQFQGSRKDGCFDLHIYGTSPGVIILEYLDITERKLSERITQARGRLLEFAGTHSLDELLQAALDETEALTGSQVGFYHFLEADQATLWLQSWSTRTAQSYCRAEGKGAHYSVDQAGVWADCVREKRAVIHNDYAALLNRKGLPEGHAKLSRELVVPVLRNQKIVAILGVGNKPWDYTERDLQAVVELAELAWDIVGRKRAEQALQKSEALLNETQALAKVGGWEYDCLLKKTSWTREVYQIYGISEERDPIQVIRESGYYEAQDQLVLNEALRLAVEHGQVFDLELRFVTAQGKHLWVRTRGNAILQNGVVSKVTGTIMDISERKMAELALEASEEQLRLAMDASTDGLWDWYPQKNITYFNQAYLAMLGYVQGEVPVTMEGWFDILHPDDQELMRQTNDDWLQGRVRSCEIEIRLRARDGSYKWILSRGKVVKWDADNRPLRIIGTHVDITERKLDEEVQQIVKTKLEGRLVESEAIQESLIQLATRDGLTGLYNRRFMNDSLLHELVRAEREGSTVCVLLLDIDHFKQFNDTYGHQVGDDVLVALSSLLLASTRESDIACRFGGEEFVVILPGADADGALNRAEMIRKDFSLLRTKTDNLGATVSVGLAIYPQHGLTVDDILRAADVAMYAAKNAGRNCVRIFKEFSAIQR